MSFREKLCLSIGLFLGLVVSVVAVLMTVYSPSSRPPLGSAKAPMLEIVEGVSLELTDRTVWYEHTDPQKATADKPQTITFTGGYHTDNTDMILIMRADGCADPARAAQDDLSSERQRAFNDHGLTAANLADARFGGAVGSKDQYPYVGYCLRDSRNDLVFAKLFLSIGPQCVVLQTQEINGNECPIGDVEGFVKAFRIRE